MLLIFGSPRSGTTLLAVALSQHPEIFVTYEADLVVPLCHLVMRTREGDEGREAILRFILASNESHRIFRPHLSEEELRKVVFGVEYKVVSIMEGLYAALGARLGKRIMGDKTPNDMANLTLLNDAGYLHAGHRVIHLVRDVRDTILSLGKVSWRPPDGFEPGMTAAWQRYNIQLQRRFVKFGNPEEYRLLRFEDFVKDPESALRGLCAFLGVEFHSAMLEPKALSEHSGAYTWEGHDNLGKGFMPHRAQAWKTDMPKPTRELVEFVGREGLCTFGYESDYSAPLWQPRRWKAFWRELQDAFNPAAAEPSFPRSLRKAGWD